LYLVSLLTLSRSSLKIATIKVYEMTAPAVILFGDELGITFIDNSI